MTNKLQERLREIAKECGGNRALCEKSGISERTFANWLAGSSEPKVIGISSVAQAAGVTIDWIVTGSKPKQKLGSHTEGNFDTIQIAWVDRKLKNLDQPVNLRLNINDHVPFSKNFLKEHLGHEDFDELCVMEISGDSMSPTMNDSDFVLIDRNQRDTDDGLFAYLFKGTVYIKRLINVLNGIDVISDNKSLYPAQHIAHEDLNNFNIIGRIVWIGKTIS